MRTPDEIKKGLRFCALPDNSTINKCAFCSYEACPGCENTLKADALEYIQRLETGVERVYKLTMALENALKGGEP